MKTTITAYWVILTLAATIGVAAEHSAGASQPSAEFERLKTLVGIWQGTADMDRDRLR